MENKRLAILALILALVAVVVAGLGLFYPPCPIPEAVVQWVTNYTGIEIDTPGGSTHVALDVDQTGSGDIADFKDGGTTVWQIADGGEVSGTGGQAWTLGAAKKLLVDADTTNHTGTAGVLDINFGTVITNASAINVAATTDTGTTAAADTFGMVMTLTQNDADADAFGISISAAQTTNSAANSYEAGLMYDCAITTAGGCLDGVRLLSSGVSGGMVDAVDASAANIVNALNAGANDVLFGDDTLDGAVDDSLRYTRNDSGAVTFTCADDDANATCIYDSGGTGSVQLGTADTTLVSSAVGFTIAGPLSVDDGSVLVATYAGALTPLTSAVVITAASTITNATMSACDTDGQLAFIAIAGSYDVTITEGSTLYAGGSIALDASEFDGVILMCYSTKWRKMGAFADN